MRGSGFDPRRRAQPLVSTRSKRQLRVSSRPLNSTHRIRPHAPISPTGILTARSFALWV